MKTIAVLTICLGLAACATVKESYAPDGRKAYAINCSGPALGWDKCFTAAGEQCGASGYDVLDRTGERQSSAAATGNSSGFGYGASASTARSMLIACKKQP